MTDPLRSLGEALGPSHWPTLVVVGGRFIGLMLAAPLWNLAEIPRSVRAALVLVFTAAVLPGVAEARLPPDFAGYVGPLACELVLGLAIGLTAAVFMAGVGLAGEIASIQMGLHLGPSLSGMAEEPTAGLGELKTMLALVIYVTLGGHLLLLTGVAESFHAIPPGTALDVVAGGRAVAVLAGTVFTAGLHVAAPITVALLLTNFGISILSRAVPQLNSMAMAFPVTIGLGFLALGASLPYVGRFLGEWVVSLPRAVETMVGAFAPGAR
jgi:flagellar biosynthetic protein FliR